MTEPASPPTQEPVESTAPGITADDRHDQAAGSTGDTAALRNEAASHRRKARQAEAERDGLRVRLEALQRAEVERVATERGEDFDPLRDASDLWRADGVEFAAMLNADGDVDHALVRAAVEAIGDTRPHWIKRRPVPAGDSDAGRGVPTPVPPPSFGAALKGSR